MTRLLSNARLMLAARGLRAAVRYFVLAVLV